MKNLDATLDHHRGLTRDASRHGIGIYLLGGPIFRILTPDKKLITAEMLGHSLALLCRWTGQCNRFYSVAQHCVMVSRLVPRELALQGLLHDASEAFIGDINRPTKALMGELAPGVLHDVEEGLHRAVAERFGSGYPHEPEVKEADNKALATEMRDLLGVDSKEWYHLPEPLERKIRPLGPRAAETAWMKRFVQLTKEN